MIKNNWNIISNSPDCSHIFKDPPIVGYRRLPNLRDQVMNAVVQYPAIHQIESDIMPKICTID